MIENIDRVLERGEKIELLVDKSDRLNQQSFKFEKTVSLLCYVWCLANSRSRERLRIQCGGARSETIAFCSQ